MGRSPWFDPGSTLFVAQPRTGPLPTPTDLGCTKHTATQVVPLRTAADPDRVGTRVVADLSLVPRVTVGPTDASDRIRCSGPAMRSSIVWVLGTQAGPSRVPLSIVIGGVGLLGLAALIDPRSRGLRRGLH